MGSDYILKRFVNFLDRDGFRRSERLVCDGCSQRRKRATAFHWVSNVNGNNFYVEAGSDMS
jgi:hypothetical protein